MATADETQELLDELAAMSLCSPEDVRVWLKETSRVGGALGQQLARLRSLVDEAEDAEPNEQVAARMETIIQQLGAQTRIVGNIQKEARFLRTSMRSLAARTAEMRALAVEAGYRAE